MSSSVLVKLFTVVTQVGFAVCKCSICKSVSVKKHIFQGCVKLRLIYSYLLRVSEEGA